MLPARQLCSPQPFNPWGCVGYLPKYALMELGYVAASSEKNQLRRRGADAAFCVLGGGRLLNPGAPAAAAEAPPPADRGRRSPEPGPD